MDAIAEWTAAVERVDALLRGVDADRAQLRVPATPDWTVRDLLAHMIGLDADVLAGDEPDDHNEAWTQRQVDARGGLAIAELLAEWRTLITPMQDWMRANTVRPLGDVIIHEQDLRGALGVSGGQHTDGLAAIRDRMLGRFADLLADDAAPIALVGDDWQWCSAGPVPDAAVVVRASDFDLTRALMSRRSAAQLRAWTTRGEVGDHLDAFRTLGPLPMVNLSE